MQLICPFSIAGGHPERCQGPDCAAYLGGDCVLLEAAGALSSIALALDGIATYPKTEAP